MNEENERKFLGPFARRSLPVMSQEGGPNVERDLRSAAMDLLKRQLHGTTEETEDESQSPSSSAVKMEPVKRIKTEALDSNEEPPETVVTHEDVKVKKLEPKRRPLSQLFEGMVFCVSGIVNPERAQVRQSALDMGGVFKNDWDDECTVLLCPFLSTPKVRQVQNSGHGLIVKPQYILDCYAHRSRLPLYSYILKPLVNDMNDDDEEEDAVEEEEANWEYLAFGCILEDPQAAIESDTERLLALLSSSLPLPNLFQGLVVYFDTAALSADVIPVLYRYLIAYGGHVSSSLEDSATTHICKETSFGSDTVKSEIPAISPEWILACHAAQEILPLNALSRLA